MLDRNRCAPLRHSIEGLDAVQPFALGYALLQIEARWRRIARCAAPLCRLDGHVRKLLRMPEQNKNKAKAYCSVGCRESLTAARFVRLVGKDGQRCCASALSVGVSALASPW